MPIKSFTELQKELQAARNLPDVTPASGISESAGDTSGVARGGLAPLKLNGPLRLNCGSGQRPFDFPWVNCDCQGKWLTPTDGRIYVKCDIRSMPMFSDNSAEIIVFHHVLEHFGLGEGDGALREAYRILQPGGSIVITVPDLRALAQRWLTGQIEEYIFLVNTYGAFMSDEVDRHRWGGSQAGWLQHIERTLGPLGAAVKLFDWRNLESADIAKDWWIAGIEVVK